MTTSSPAAPNWPPNIALRDADGLIMAVGDDDALARGQAAGLDDDR